MRGLLYLVTLATLNALAIATPSVPSSCPNANLLQTAEIPATTGNSVLSYAQFECNPATTKRDVIISVGGIVNPILCALFRIDCPPPPPPYHQPPPPPKNINECGAGCSISCNNVTAGTLPPIAADCDEIVNSFVPFNESINPFFSVQSGHVETLTFGTCTISFENFGSEELTYCWSDLTSVATSAGNACFPPNAFSFGQGVCAGYDGLWAVTESHS